jgi:hypothetical protein
MGDELRLLGGDDTPALQVATRHRKELLDKISQSMLDYMFKKLAAGKPIVYPNDIAGWTLENLEMLREAKMRTIPEASALIDGEFTRLWWLVKSCL